MEKPFREVSFRHGFAVPPILAAARSRSRSDTTPWCHSLRSRRFATSRREAGRTARPPKIGGIRRDCAIFSRSAMGGVLGEGCIGARNLPLPFFSRPKARARLWGKPHNTEKRLRKCQGRLRAGSFRHFLAKMPPPSRREALS